MKVIAYGQRTWRIAAAVVLVAVVCSSGQSLAQPFADVHRAGIPSSEMDFVAAAQQSSQWCWAASIQMVLGYHGVAITQQQIVARTYGTNLWGGLPDWPGSFEAITANLNNWSIDNYGQQYAVAAILNWGAPTPAVLIRELQNKRPVIIGYREANSGHAVVVTAVTFSKTLYGPVIGSIVVRDPWPSQKNVRNSGRTEHDAAWLAQRITAHWFISVVRSRSPLGQAPQDRRGAIDELSNVKESSNLAFRAEGRSVTVSRTRRGGRIGGGRARTQMFVGAHGVRARYSGHEQLDAYRYGQGG